MRFQNFNTVFICSSLSKFCSISSTDLVNTDSSRTLQRSSGKSMMQKVQRKKHKLGVIKDLRKDANGGPPNRQQRSRGDLEEESAKTSMYNKIKRSWRG